VAIKCIINDRCLDADAHDIQLRQFRNEVDLMMRMRHPNIVLLMGALVHPPRLCIISELCTKGSLYQLLHKKEGKPIPGGMARLLLMMMDAARGCHFLHTHDPCVVHLDLKSPNLLVDKNYNVKVADFGLAALKKHFFFQTGNSPVGTPEWTAPEVLKGEPFNEKADLYSFGVVLVRVPAFAPFHSLVLCLLVVTVT
jgi:serine/threonine protein kinase